MSLGWRRSPVSLWDGTGVPPGCPLPGGDRGVPGVPREFRFTAEVPIWLDYRGKRVTMEQVTGTRPGGQRGGTVGSLGGTDLSLG